MLQKVQNPLGLPRGLSSPLLSSYPNSSLPPLLHPSLFIFCLHSLTPPFDPLSLTTPSSPVMDIGCVIS